MSPQFAVAYLTVAVAGLGLGLDIHNVDVVRLVLRRQITSGSALRSEVKMRWISHVDLRWLDHRGHD